MNPNIGNGSSFTKQVTIPRSNVEGVWKFSYSKSTVGCTGNILVKWNSQAEQVTVGQFHWYQSFTWLRHKKRRFMCLEYWGSARIITNLEVVSTILAYFLSYFLLTWVECEIWGKEKDLAVIIVWKEEMRQLVFIDSIFSCADVINALWIIEQMYRLSFSGRH